MEALNMVGHLIRRLGQVSTSVFAERIQAAGHDLTPVQFAALDAIHAQGGLDQARIAARIAYDRATIGGVIDRLEKKGLVCREISKSDRRAREVFLTEQGAALYDEVLPIVKALQADITAGLTADETAQFLDLARKALGKIVR